MRHGADRALLAPSSDQPRVDPSGGADLDPNRRVGRLDQDGPQRRIVLPGPPGGTLAGTLIPALPCRRGGQTEPERADRLVAVHGRRRPQQHATGGMPRQAAKASGRDGGPFSGALPWGTVHRSAGAGPHGTGSREPAGRPPSGPRPRPSYTRRCLPSRRSCSMQAATAAGVSPGHRSVSDSLVAPVASSARTVSTRSPLVRRTGPRQRSETTGPRITSLANVTSSYAGWGVALTALAGPLCCSAGRAAIRPEVGATACRPPMTSACGGGRRIRRLRVRSERVADEQSGRSPRASKPASLAAGAPTSVGEDHVGGGPSAGPGRGRARRYDGARRPSTAANGQVRPGRRPALVGHAPAGRTGKRALPDDQRRDRLRWLAGPSAPRWVGEHGALGRRARPALAPGPHGPVRASRRWLPWRNAVARQRRSRSADLSGIPPGGERRLHRVERFRWPSELHQPRSRPGPLARPEGPRAGRPLAWAGADPARRSDRLARPCPSLNQKAPSHRHGWRCARAYPETRWQLSSDRQVGPADWSVARGPAGAVLRRASHVALPRPSGS